MSSLQAIILVLFGRDSPPQLQALGGDRWRILPPPPPAPIGPGGAVVAQSLVSEVIRGAVVGPPQSAAERLGI